MSSERANGDYSRRGNFGVSLVYHMFGPHQCGQRRWKYFKERGQVEGGRIEWGDGILDFRSRNSGRVLDFWWILRLKVKAKIDAFSNVTEGPCLSCPKFCGH